MTQVDFEFIRVFVAQIRIAGDDAIVLTGELDELLGVVATVRCQPHRFTLLEELEADRLSHCGVHEPDADLRG